MFSLCCYRRQETFVNLGLFQTTSNYSWFLCLCLVMAFHSILFLYTSSLISFNHVKKKKMLIKKSLQYEVFPGGQPSRYYPRPTGFDFGDQTSPGFFSCGMIVDKRRS